LTPQANLQPGAWLPIAVTSTIDESYPMEIEVAGEKYVIWRNKQPAAQNTEQGWSVMRNICPHRLAPLSEGRIDGQTGCLECPYHGWQFNSTGKLLRQ
jgi:phenylpropionate dioxygenase-like ring-hydroxylating dioxygenase large terminal subunit